MRQDFWFDSCGTGKIHVCRWVPEEEPSAVLQIVHGIAEFVERYDTFAEYLNQLGFLVVAEDHMGHGQSINEDGIQGYFHGGWFCAVADTYRLLTDTKAEYPSLPYILFGHSMGSFIARTILCEYPDSGITAAVLCGTGWVPGSLLSPMLRVAEAACARNGETVPAETLQNTMFGAFNGKVEHRRTAYDWICRDARVVDAYIAHPLCGFTVSGGLMRDMLKGIRYIQQKENLERMKKELPVFFISGGEDPVGLYGKGVHRCAGAFRDSGMEDVSVRIFPLCRHEILNEINKEEVFGVLTQWIENKL